MDNIVLYSIVGTVFLTAIILGFIAFKMWLKREQKEEVKEGTPLVRDFNRTNQHLSKLLDNVESSAEQAGQLMEDIREKTRTLINLSIGLYREAERLNEEISFLDFAIEAVTNRDIVKIRRAGAELHDLDLQALLQAEVQGTDFWDKAIETLNSQAGLMGKQSRTFRRLAIGLLGDVRNNKARLVDLQQQRKFADYARPLLESNLNIQRAEHLLMLPTNNKVRQFTIDTPTAYSELTSGEL